MTSQNALERFHKLIPSKILTGVLLIAVSWLPSGQAVQGNFNAEPQNQVLNADPSREWLAEEYVDTIFTEFQRRYPHLKLTIDEKEISEFAQKPNEVWKVTKVFHDFMSAWKESRKSPAFSRNGAAVNAVMATLPSALMTITSNLEYGESILLENDKSLAGRLFEWLIAQPEHSVTPHDFMLKSLEYSRGKVVTAWSIAWNILSAGWAAAATRNYSPLHAKFISLTGERYLWAGAAHYVILPPDQWVPIESQIKTRDEIKQYRSKRKILKLVITKRGDEFSYLYHRVGVELYTLLVSKLAGSNEAGLALGSIAAIGEVLKHSVTAGPKVENHKRINNDLMGAKSGSRLYQLVTGEREIDIPLKPMGAKDYLRSNRIKFGEKYQLPLGMPPQYFRMGVDRKFWSSTMSLEELKLRFHHAVTIDSQIFDPILLTSTGESERLHRGLVAYTEQGAHDAELNADIRAWLDGVRARPMVEDVKEDLNMAVKDNSSFVKGLERNFAFKTADDYLTRLLIRVLAETEHRKSLAPVCRQALLH